MAVTITVNGQERSLDVEPDTPLLWAIRDTLGLTGTKFGCGIAACGACTVHVNGTRRALVHAAGRRRSTGASVTTIEGPGRRAARCTPVQQAWIDHQVPQCGYCQSGMIMAVVGAPRRAAARRPTPRSTTAITNICRCGTFARVRRAIHALADELKEARHGQMDTTRLHRRRHARRRRLRAGRGRRGVRAEPPQRASPTTRADTGELNTWILVTPDNIVTVLVPHCEMGQGAQTALAMMAAEEMDADWTLVRVKEAPALDAYANALHRRARSSAIDSRPARARLRLRHLSPRALRRAAGRPAARCRCAAPGATACASPAPPRAKCSSPPRPRRFGVARVGVHGAELARRPRSVGQVRDVRRAGDSRGEAVGAVQPALKDPDAYTHPPHAARRASTFRSKVDGSAIYGIDFTHAGHAVRRRRDRARSSAASWCRWTRPPPRRCPASSASSGSTKAVAVVADSYWRARKALGDARSRSSTMPATARVSTRDDLRCVRQGARRARRRCRTARRRWSRPTTGCRSWRTRRWSRWPARRGSTAIGAEVWAGTQDPLNARGHGGEGARPRHAEQVRVHEPRARRRLRAPASLHISTSSTSARASPRRCRRRR